MCVQCTWLANLLGDLSNGKKRIPISIETIFPGEKRRFNTKRVARRSGGI
jgi:hypothetical protein